MEETRHLVRRTKSLALPELALVPVVVPSEPEDDDEHDGFTDEDFEDKEMIRGYINDLLKVYVGKADK